MITILYDLEQGTDEWLEFRKDKISATDAYDLLNGLSISTILENKQSDFGGSFATERGHLLEKEAREIYASLNGVDVQEAGAILNSDYPNCMCSPDGLVGEDTLIEIKSFMKEHHEDAIENLDAHLIAQTQFQLLISGRRKVDFVAYNPEESDLKKAFVVTPIYPNPEIQAKLKKLLTASDEPDENLEQNALALLKLQSEIALQEAELSTQLEDYQAKKQQLETLKQKLKESTTGKVKKTLELNGATLDLSIYDTHKVEVEDPSKVADEFVTLVEVQDYVKKGKKFYQKVPNPKLVQNFVKAGKTLPDGFKDKVTRTIKLKFNGKSI